jgi:hypothetical protein
MRRIRFACLFAILTSMLVVAQSSRAPFGNQPNGLPVAQQRHPAMPPNLFQMPHGALFAQRRATGLNVPGTRGAFDNLTWPTCARHIWPTFG